MLKKIKKNAVLFRIIAWAGVIICIFSRFLLGNVTNPYFLFLGTPLVIIGLIGLIVAHFKKY